jgi:hypothetical protein
MSHFVYATLASLFMSSTVFSQNFNYQVKLDPIAIPQMGGLQSFAVGQHNGKWLLVGGRLDGLHRRQPWASFDIAGHNNQIWVVDPVSKQKWTAPLSGLPTSVQEQLSATNPEFYQTGDYLYVLGGYGYSATAGDHITFPFLTALHLPSIIDSVIAGTSFGSAVRQLNDPEFQVTGGQLQKMDSVYYLLGGQKFMGRYNPMGPTHGPGFVQEYTNAIKRFTLTDDGTTLAINHLSSFTHPTQLHRRDYNAKPQILPNGAQGITMFSGVFQPTVDLPFLSPVDVSPTGFNEDTAFQQKFNHYHCASLPMYSQNKQEMYTLFFGGIAQFYWNNGQVVQDNNVPFVNTIAYVQVDANGVKSEHKLTAEMPALLGAGAEFMPNENLAHYPNQVLKLDALTQDTTLAGYIFGGINSSAPNIFFTNNGTQSSANANIYKVYLIKNSLSQNSYPLQKEQGLNWMVYPNPTAGAISLQFQLENVVPVRLSISNLNGQRLKQFTLTNTQQGANEHNLKLDNLAPNQAYIFTLEADGKTLSRKVILE